MTSPKIPTTLKTLITLNNATTDDSDNKIDGSKVFVAECTYILIVILLFQETNTWVQSSTQTNDAFSVLFAPFECKAGFVFPV